MWAAANGKHSAKDTLCVVLQQATANLLVKRKPAHTKALCLAKTSVDSLNVAGVSGWVLDGLSDLLMLSEPPTAGSELIWTEQEVLSSELKGFVRKKNKCVRNKAKKLARKSSKNRRMGR